MNPSSGRPLPDLEDPDFAPFWRSCAAGELRVVRCLGCGEKRWPPRPVCPWCSSPEQEWVRVGPGGTIYSWTRTARPIVPGFAPPFVVVIVEVAEGVRLLGNLLDAAGQEVAVGMPVEAVFVPAGNGVVLPQWRLAANAGSQKF